jgi:hypothetical protein
MDIFIGIVIAGQFILFAYLYGWYTGRIALRSDLGLTETPETTEVINPEETL